MAQGTAPAHKFEREKERIREESIPDPDKDAIIEVLDALDPNNITYSFTNGDSEAVTHSYNTLESYGVSLRKLAKATDCLLEECELGTINEVFDHWLSEYAKQTVKQHQAAAKAFYRYHDTPVDAEEIKLVKVPEGGTVDEQDMFSTDDIQAMREACTNARDRCLLELFIYTGQRLRAIQTLRVKDIDLENSVYYLNDDVEGLKGADRQSRKRPLLGAEKAVRDWLNMHPTGDPDAALITALPDARHGDGTEPISATTINRTLKKIADRADVDKPVNPHNFRHYFVTICHRRYDMEESTIKFLIGHGPGSRIMETTYSHLTADDHIGAARVATGEKEPEEERDAFTPPKCTVCSEPLPPDAKACPGCGTVYTPDARNAQDKIKDTVQEGKESADDLEEYSDLDELERMVNENPELLEMLKDLVQD